MTTKSKKKIYRRKRLIIPLTIVVLLVAFRLYLPTLVKNYVNQVLAEIPDYYGQVEDIDIALFRGAYVIHGMYLNKVNAKSQIPFLNFPKSDISIEWKSLFNGKVVSEIIMFDPEVIYVFEDQQEESADVDLDDWTKALTDLVPIDINHLEIHNGKFAFVELRADPNVDLNINQVELVADNLRNVVAQERVLPSSLRANGVSFGGGQLSIEGKMNLIKEIPDMDISLSLEKADATALNDFTKYYTGMDFKQGVFNFYSEVAIADGYLKGYVKPMLTDLKLISKEDSVLQILWEGLVGFFKFAFKNQKTNTIATRIPMEGDLNQVDSKVWPAVVSIFQNAWIKAFKTSVDDNIEFKDAFREAD